LNFSYLDPIEDANQTPPFSLGNRSTLFDQYTIANRRRIRLIMDYKLRNLPTRLIVNPVTLYQSHTYNTPLVILVFQDSTRLLFARHPILLAPTIQAIYLPDLQ
jgi:hypothetical protein